ncbi:MAG: DUF4465 domain-containing protein [Paludibacteraceae bacterium]|nr:DUF4465 domain-containing protein [Paludibacteraceae bacterium]
MKKTLSLLVVALLAAFSAFAAEVKLVMADYADQFVDNQATQTITADGITLLFEKQNGGSNPTFNASGLDARLYAKGTLTISAGFEMQKIVFDMSANGLKRACDITASVGECLTDTANKVYVWTGAANEITLTVGEKATHGSEGESKAAQFDFTALTITTDGEIVVPVEKANPYLLSYDEGEFEYTELGNWAATFDSAAKFVMSGAFALQHYGDTLYYPYTDPETGEIFNTPYPTWNGFIPTIAKEDGAGYQYYSCVAKGGVRGEGTPYTLAYWQGANTILFAEDEILKATPKEVYFCNANVTYNDINNGNDFGAKKYAEGDYLYVKVQGILGADTAGFILTENSVDYYLADFRDGKTFVNNAWEKVDLSELGEVYGLTFSMESTDVGQYGINTATYFAIDQLLIEPVKPEVVTPAFEFNYAQAGYELYEGAHTWQIDLSHDLDEENYDLWLSFAFETTSATAIAGTYDVADMYWAEYDVVDGADTTTIELTSGTLTIDYVGEGEESYVYTLSFEGVDVNGNEVKFSQTIEVLCFDYATYDYITMNEGGDVTPIESDIEFNYGQAVYMNDYYADNGYSLPVPLWEVDAYQLISNTDYTALLTVGVFTESETSIVGNYDIADAVWAELDLVDGTDTTIIELVSGTISIEYLGQSEDNYPVYSYTVVAKDSLDQDYNLAYEGEFVCWNALTKDDIYMTGDGEPAPVEAETLTVAEALEIINALADNDSTDVDYSVAGYVVKIKYTYSEQYGTATFWIDDTQAESEALQAYSCAPETEADKEVKVGDIVLVTGKLTKYVNKSGAVTPEVNRGTYTIIDEIPDGLELVNAESLVRVINDELVVDAIGNVQIYNVQGQLIYNAQVAGQTTIRGLQQGQVLLVRVNNQIAKVVF